MSSSGSFARPRTGRPSWPGSGSLRIAALYTGGFLGPFGTNVVTPVLPEIGSDFHVSTGSAALSLTAYLVPFAGLMLVSGTWGQRWGVRRTTRAGYVLYLVATLVCIAPLPFGAFLAGRAAQGTANAFITPLMLASIARVTPPPRLGRALGLFAALQSAAMTGAPLIAGLVAQASWRWAFVGTAVVAGLLGIIGLPASVDSPESGSATPRLRQVLRPATLRVAVAAFIAWLCLGGLAFLVSFRAEDLLHLGADARGILLTVYGVAGIVTASPIGWVVDRIGGRWCVITGMIAGAGLLVGVGLAGNTIALGALWALCGVSSQLALVGVNALALSGVDNRAGAVSVVHAFRFSGSAVSPIAFTPLYHADPLAAFIVPAAIMVAGSPVILGVSSGTAAPPDPTRTP